MTELQHQQMVIKWTQQPKIRQKWPELKLLHHIPNERYCTPAQGTQLKLAGVRKGVPDLCLPVPHGRYHGLYIEMKREDGTPTEDQKWWGEKLQSYGYAWAVCHGYEEAIGALRWYLEMPAAGLRKRL